FPTHGGGSACTSSDAATSRWTTFGFERWHNDVARVVMQDFARFCEMIAWGLSVALAYYPGVRALNHQGVAAYTTTPLRVLRDPLPADATLIGPHAPHIFGSGHRRGA